MPRPATARLGLTLHLRDTLPMDTEFEVGLLTQTPSVEGHGAVELDAPGYARARAIFEAHRPDDPGMRTAAALELGPPSEWSASWVGLFRVGGALLGYGPLEGVSTNVGPVGFAAGALTIWR